MPTGEEKFDALMKDLQAFETDLRTQASKKRLLAQQFEANAKKDPANRDFDLTQSRMLDYQHQLLNDIGNIVEKLIKQHEK